MLIKQQAVSSALCPAQRAQPSPVLLNYNSVLSIQQISWSHHPLEKVLIVTASIIKYGSTVCQAVGGKNALKDMYVCLSIQSYSYEVVLALWQKAGVHQQKARVEWKLNFLGVSRETLINVFWITGYTNTLLFISILFYSEISIELI